MKRLHMFTFPLACAVALVVLSFFLGSTEEVFTYTEPKQELSTFIPEGVTAKAYAVFVLESGSILASQSGDTVLPIASVTKLVTATTLHKQKDIDTKTMVTEGDIATVGRAGKLVSNEQYTPRELIAPLLLESSNDAGATLSRLYPNLVVEMNNFASTQGLIKTIFTDTTGLSTDNVSTANELATLLRSIYTQDRHVFDITMQKESVGEYTGWINNNPVARLTGFTGGKHGYTEASGKTLVAVFEETLAGGTEIEVGYVLLNSTDLKKDIELLRKEVVKNVEFK